MEKSNYATITGLCNVQKSASNGDSDEGWGLALRKVGNFLSSMVMGFIPAYSVTDGLLNQKNMILIYNIS